MTRDLNAVQTLGPAPHHPERPSVETEDLSHDHTRQGTFSDGGGDTHLIHNQSYSGTEGNENLVRLPE